MSIINYHIFKLNHFNSKLMCANNMKLMDSKNQPQTMHIEYNLRILRQLASHSQADEIV